MEVCYQLPVLPLDRPVPKHVLSRRGAISFSSTSSLFGGPDPRKLSQRRGGISYDSADQTALYIRMLGDVRVRSQVGFESQRRGSHPYLYVDFRGLYPPSTESVSPWGCRCCRPLSFQRRLTVSPSLLCPSSRLALCFLDDDYAGQAKCMLRKVGSWDFDIFLFDRLTNGNSLATLAAHLFNQYGLIELFQLDVIKLHRFLVSVQEDYHSHNPYHNAVHAADVTQAMYCYLREPQLSSSLTSCDILLGILAASTHDLDHPGVNQSFLIKTKHHLASLYQCLLYRGDTMCIYDANVPSVLRRLEECTLPYSYECVMVLEFHPSAVLLKACTLKNTSVLENHHWRSAVGLLRQTGLLEHLPVEDRQNLEMRLGSLILATDISRQNEYLSQFRTHLDQEDLNLQNSAHRHLVLQMALKCADICNPCRPWELSKQWSGKVTEEFFNQGDIEKKHGLEVSPLCNRQSDTVPNIQSGFMSYVVEPLFTEWRRFCSTPLSHTMLSHLGLNKARWREESDLSAKTKPQGNQGS